MAKDRESKSTREKAAAARAEQMAAEQRRERTVRIIGAIAVVAVVAIIIGLAVIVPRLSSDDSGGDLPGPDPAAPVPTGVYGSDSEYAYGVPFGTAAETAPVLQLWEDFQCPACGALEAVNGAGIESLAEAGDMQLIWRPTAFLDNNLGNTSSAEAINAWGCAIDAGKTAEYHNELFANQPETEGDGWTTEQFVAIAENVGITGVPLEQFNDCLTSGRYLPWAANSTKVFYDSNIQGTPTGILNGTVVESANLADQGTLEQLVKDASAQ